MAFEEVTERQSSIKLSRNSKNQYTWDIKVYFDESDVSNDVIEKVEGLNNLLKQRFTGGR